jgi:hypothetical protein
MLRSAFEPGSTRWAEWRATGVSEDDFRKPKITVVDPWDLRLK